MSDGVAWMANENDRAEQDQGRALTDPTFAPVLFVVDTTTEGDRIYKTICSAHGFSTAVIYK